MNDTPYSFCRNRDLGTISVYIGSTVDHPYMNMCMHMRMCMHRYVIHICFPLINTPNLRGGDNKPTDPFMGVSFEEDLRF